MKCRWEDNRAIDLIEIDEKGSSKFVWLRIRPGADSAKHGTVISGCIKAGYFFKTRVILVFQGRRSWCYI
jgi:hypothetical protein